jgi:hypothetical protein
MRLIPMSANVTATTWLASPDTAAQDKGAYVYPGPAPIIDRVVWPFEAQPTKLKIKTEVTATAGHRVTLPSTVTHSVDQAALGLNSDFGPVVVES